MSSHPENADISELFSTIIKPLSCSLSNESQEITIVKDTRAYSLYGQASITEQYNCNYSLNEDHRAKFENSQLRIVGINLFGDIRMVELREHPFFMAMLFQPQLAIPESLGHPVVMGFLRAASNSAKT